MENSLKGLILAAGTVITCLVISLGFYLSKEAQGTANTGISKIGKINAEFAENDKVMYDGTKVSGNEVVNVIRKFEDENLGVYVTTNGGAAYYGYNFDLKTGELAAKSENVYDENVESGACGYINPYAMFKGKVVRNSNGVITGITFTQL